MIYLHAPIYRLLRLHQTTCLLHYVLASHLIRAMFKISCCRNFVLPSGNFTTPKIAVIMVLRLIYVWRYSTTKCSIHKVLYPSVNVSLLFVCVSALYLYILYLVVRICILLILFSSCFLSHTIYFLFWVWLKLVTSNVLSRYVYAYLVHVYYFLSVFDLYYSVIYTSD